MRDLSTKPKTLTEKGIRHFFIKKSKKYPYNLTGERHSKGLNLNKASPLSEEIHLLDGESSRVEEPFSELVIESQHIQRENSSFQ